MFTAKVYKIAVITLSGIMEGVYVAKETIRIWNQNYAGSTGKLFLPVEDIQNAEIIVGIVGNWVEHTTLIDDSLKAGKKVLLFFNEYQDPNNTIDVEYKAVADYKRAKQLICPCASYIGAPELSRMLEASLNEVQ